MKDRIILEFFKKYWKTYLVGIVFLLLNSYIQALGPRILGETIDLLEAEIIDRHKVLLYLGAMVLVAIATFITRFIWRYCINGNGRNMEVFLRQKLFAHLQKMSVEFFNNKKTGDLMAYGINDVGAVRQAFGPGVAHLINGVGLGSISVFAMIGTVDYRLTIVCMIPILATVFLILKMGQKIRQRFRVVQESFGAVSDRVQENISGIRVIKSYVQEDGEVERFEKLNEKMKEANIRMVRLSSVLNPLVQIFFGLSFAISLIYGSSLVRRGAISLGDFVAFNGYLSMVIGPVMAVSRIINIFQRGMASYKRLKEIFEVEPEIVDGVSDEPIEEIKGSIEIKDLTFTYPGATEPALKNINICLPQGKILGIIGKTGCGKTTLVNLLLKLYNVENGRIFIDGRDINEFPLKTLRENIGYVPQDNFLFSATITDNIRFFSDAYSQEEVEEAARMSHIYDNIMEFPDKFDTMVGERGVNLSGGQKQRIAIARAIIKKPAVLILDDSLSAVDTETEEGIIRNLKTVLRGRTGIIIAHRISAIKHADQIIVMDHGRIVESGTHEELLENGKLYYELYREQFKKEQKKVAYETA